MPHVVAQPSIEVDALGKSYLTGRAVIPVLKDVEFRIQPGEFVAILGPSGGGKSTLLNLIAGLDAPDDGEVWVEGEAPGTAPHIAYMQQKDLLLPWRTVWDNVLLAPELRSAEDRKSAETQARHLLAMFHLERFASALPAQLSGGMRQRVALIRTLLCGRNILLLDEPFGALDAMTRGKLQRHLLQVWREFQKTIVLVTHDVEEALLLSTRILLLTAAPGRVMADIPVDMPHEGRERSAEIAAMKASILAQLEGPNG